MFGHVTLLTSLSLYNYRSLYAIVYIFDPSLASQYQNYSMWRSHLYLLQNSEDQEFLKELSSYVRASIPDHVTVLDTTTCCAYTLRLRVM